MPINEAKEVEEVRVIIRIKLPSNIDGSMCVRFFFCLYAVYSAHLAAGTKRTYSFDIFDLFPFSIVGYR